MSNRLLLRIAAVFSVAMVPVILWFAIDAIPPRSVIEAEAHGNRMGPWTFTWGLAWIGVLAACLVGWLCILASNAPENSQAAAGQPNAKS